MVAESEWESILTNWASEGSAITSLVLDKSQECLDVYRRSPSRIREDYGTEQAIAEGGYGHRQLFELVQNGADAILDCRPGDPIAFGGRIEVVLTRDALYCANEGAPIEPQGVEAILFSHMSNKRGAEIGHFGLGFKSVLAITRHPQFYSRSGSFGFDTRKSHEAILNAAAEAAEHLAPGDREKLPGLRIAQPLNPYDAARTDHVLHELMGWAATVVKLPRDGRRAAGLDADLRGFPARFLLFSPHVASLRLRDVATESERVLSASRSEDGAITLSDDGEESTWRVFHCDHEPSAVAREDGGTIAGRATVPIDWAVPMRSRRQDRGQFWAFFPTTYETTLSGVLNAPWKTNADRQGLLEGPYNRELLNRAASLVAESLAVLFNRDDPGEILDRLPARDPLQWADAALAESVYGALAQSPSLPDSACVLRIPGGIAILPPEIESAMPVWDSFSPLPSGWAHHSVGPRERRSRAERLGAQSANVRTWLEAVAAERTPEASIRALRLIDALYPEGRIPPGTLVRGAAVILSESGELVAASNGALLLNTEFSRGNDTLLLVDPRVEEDPTAASVLQAFGLKGASPLDELKRLTPPTSVGETWERFWAVLRWVDLSDADAADFVKANRYKIKVRTMAATWSHNYEALLPGAIVSLDDLSDPEFTIDVDYHAGELDSITPLLDLVAAPRAGKFSRLEPEFASYEWRCRKQYMDELPADSSTPREDAIEFDALHDHAPVGPLTPLLGSLSTAAGVRFTTALLPVAANDMAWTMGHQSPNPDTRRRYPVRSFPPLSQYIAARYGIVDTSVGVRPVSQCVTSELTRWSRFLPCADALPSFLARPQRLEDVEPHLLHAAFERTLESTEPIVAGAFYGKLATLLERPDFIRCGFGDATDTRDPGDVAVTHFQWLYRKLLDDGNRVLLVDDERDAQALVERWGLVAGDMGEELQIHTTDPGDPVPLGDLFPNLPAHVAESVRDMDCVPCADVWREYATPAGVTTLAAQAAVGADGSLLYQSHLSRTELLDAVSSQLGIELTDDERAHTLETGTPISLRDLRRDIANEPTLESKLALIASTQELRYNIPAHVLGAAEQQQGPLDDITLSRLVLAVHGISTLGVLRPALERAGLAPPSRWAGSARALEFVRELGFPDAYGGARDAKRASWLDVRGPVRMKPLHEFQEVIATRIADFLHRHSARRGLVSLPTGAGKTRVVAESLVRAFLDGSLSETVLWIADRRELCEQAEQTWEEVWRAFGPPQTLRISRLWGETNDRVVATPGRPHVVVATYQSLRSRLDGAFSWIADAQVIVIDEAHGSIAPSYTQILRAFGLDARGTDRPLIGMTATPFRGADDDETGRLVNRYEGHRFDRDVFAGDDPYPELRRLKVLAEVEWAELEGSSIQLSGEEMRQLEQFKVLPRLAEGRLGLIAERNQDLVARVKSCPSDWPILIFATSVDHAELLAGLLTLEGISSQSISSRTADSVRSYAVEAFRRKEIRVLTNYGVLTTGFDAPETRAIFVARPVYSPGLYQQMIGRGLRGPLNGGTDQCLIVNVADNVVAYGEQLAFRHFEHMWKMGDPLQPGFSGTA